MKTNFLILIIFFNYNFLFAQSNFQVFKTDTSSIDCPLQENGSVEFYVAGGEPPYNYRIEPGGGADSSLNPSDNTFKQGNLKSGNYTLIVGDGVGRKDTLSFGIDGPDTFQFSYLKQNVRCKGESNGSLTAQVKGGTGPYGYQWRGPDGVNISTKKSIENLEAGKYELTVIDQKNCKANDTVEVTQPKKVEVSLDKTDLSCYQRNDGEIKAKVKGGTQGLSCPYYFEISDDTGTYCANENQAFKFTGLAAGGYTVIAVDDKGCKATSNINLDQPPPMEVSIDSIHHVECFNGQDGYMKFSTEGGTPPYQYDWNNPNLRGDSNVLRYLTADTYNVHIRDQNQCSKFFYKEIKEPERRKIENLGTVNTIDTAESKKLRYSARIDSPIAKYSWQPDSAISCTECRYPEVFPKQDTEYKVRITDTNGCSFEDSTLVDIEEEPEVFVPNAFTPDGDGTNDEFKPVTAYERVIENYRLIIFNRGGEQVFSSDKFNEGWQGKYEGKSVEEGTYQYIIEGEYFNGEDFSKSGRIQLIR